MKQKRILGIMVLLAAFACTKNPTEVNGHVDFDVSGNNVVADVTKSNVSDYTTLPLAEDFTINILDASSMSVWNGKISEWDAATPLLAGKYTVEASYGSLAEEGFDKPFFYGVSAFEIKGAETANVTVNVSLGNTIVKVTCSDYFTRYFSDYTFRLTRDGSEIATFVKNETRGAFIDGYKIKVEGTLTGEMKTYTFEQEYTGLDEATAYAINFDAPAVGGSTITISFNDTVETVELGDYELND